jgi:hypothetical protein
MQHFLNSGTKFTLALQKDENDGELYNKTNSCGRCLAATAFQIHRQHKEQSDEMPEKINLSDYNERQNFIGYLTRVKGNFTPQDPRYNYIDKVLLSLSDERYLSSLSSDHWPADDIRQGWKHDGATDPDIAMFQAHDDGFNYLVWASTTDAPQRRGIHSDANGRNTEHQMEGKISGKPLLPHAAQRRRSRQAILPRGDF